MYSVRQITIRIAVQMMPHVVLGEFANKLPSVLI